MESWFTIPEDHASLPGHFPGNPIVPGVTLLSEVFLAIEASFPGTFVTSIKLAKFVKPLRAGREVRISLESKASEQVKFVCRDGDEILVSGQCGLTNKDVN